MEIDCMVCHAVSGQYDFNQRREQIADENFAWAATAALRLGQVKGSVDRIRDGSDPNDEAVRAKLPTVAYDGSRFDPDGTVFMDLVRQPQNNACYQCHSTRTVDDNGIQSRWIHDQDVHLRAGMNCTDCHRNGIDHHIVRGFDGEEHPTSDATEHFTNTLSCRGCHLGVNDDDAQDVSVSIHQRSGRLGSPRPLHAGLPPLHFDKLACTACHAGPIPREEVLGVMTSLAHGLGEKGHRTGTELPRFVGPVFTKNRDGRVAPQKAMWPAFWGKMVDNKVEPLSPTKVYDATRRALRVRSDFREEVLMPKLKSSDLKEILGEDRARTRPDDWTEVERQNVEVKQKEVGRQQFDEKVYAALEAIEQELKVGTAVYVSSGLVFARGETENELREVDVSDKKPIEMITWPMVHNVRPAGWSLGVKGCIECHQDDGLIFASTVTPVGPIDGNAEPVSMAQLQGVDPNQRLAWNQMFGGRASFKYVIGGSLGVMLLAMVAGFGAYVGRLSTRRKTA